MPWYAAHIVMAVRLKGKRQSRFPVWENIILISAKTEEEAFAKAEDRGRDGEGDDEGTFRWNDQPATWMFAGIRKLSLCVDSTTRPGDGTEITFNEVELDSRLALEKYARGDRVKVTSCDQFSDEEYRLQPASQHIRLG